MSRSDLLPGAGPVLSVAQALYRAGRDYKGGVTALALEMGVDYDSLQKKLHIKDEKRHLSPVELEEVVAFTRDPRLLAALVHPAGAVAYLPVPVPATADALRALGELLEREADFVVSLHGGAADGLWEPHEVAELEYHANRVIGEILGIVAGARQSMEGDHHG